MLVQVFEEWKLMHVKLDQNLESKIDLFGERVQSTLRIYPKAPWDTSGSLNVCAWGMSTQASNTS